MLNIKKLQRYDLYAPAASKIKEKNRRTEKKIRPKGGTEKKKKD